MNFDLGNYKKNVEDNLKILESIVEILEEKIGAKVNLPLFTVEYYVDAQFIHLETYYPSEDNDGSQYVLYAYRIDIYNEHINQMSDSLNIYFDDKNLTRNIINQTVIIENELLKIFKNYETLGFYLGDNDE